MTHRPATTTRETDAAPALPATDTTRRPFTRAERDAVFATSKGICGVCKRPVRENGYHIDHIVALVSGGTNALANLQASHAICNMTKSAKDRPSWQEPDRPASQRRKSGMVYEMAFGFVEYAVAVRERGGDPFVLVETAPDKGRFIRSMDEVAIAELLEHGAYLVDAAGEAVTSGAEARYFFWPHVAMRDRRYNGGIDSGLDRVKGNECGFVNSAAKAAGRRVQILESAAKTWLGETQ